MHYLFDVMSRLSQKKDLTKISTKLSLPVNYIRIIGLHTFVRWFRKFVVSLQIVDHQSEFVTTPVLNRLQRCIIEPVLQMLHLHSVKIKKNDVLKRYLRVVRMQDVSHMRLPLFRAIFYKTLLVFTMLESNSYLILK